MDHTYERQRNRGRCPESWRVGSCRPRNPGSVAEVFGVLLARDAARRFAKDEYDQCHYKDGKGL